MNLTRPEPFVGFEGTEAVSGARFPSELHFTNGTLRIMLPRTRGFTLLEVLIAVMVFAIVLAAASSVFYGALHLRDRKSTRLNSSHVAISYAVFCLKKKTTT